jgi:hypothetical protein
MTCTSQATDLCNLLSLDTVPLDLVMAFSTVDAVLPGAIGTAEVGDSVAAEVEPAAEGTSAATVAAGVATVEAGQTDTDLGGDSSEEMRIGRGK